MTTRAMAYVRISDDPTALGLGVERQEDDARELAARRGWSLVDADIIRENDTTATNPKTLRPGFTRLVNEAQTGRAAVVIVYKVDRLSRNRPDSTRLLEAGKAGKVLIAQTAGGDVDLSRPDGRQYADMLLSFATFESELKSDRQRDKNRQLRASGRMATGSRPFGFETDGVTHRPAEAKAITAAYGWLLDGASLAEIARRWNAAGLTTTRLSGKRSSPDRQPLPWDGFRVRRVLLRPRNIGQVTFRGEIIGEGQWEPLTDEVTYAAASRLLAHQQRTTPQGDQRLLTGLARCQVCGGPVNTRGGTQDQPLYRCKIRGCISRQAIPVEKFVLETVAATLADPDARRLLTPPAEDSGAAAVLQAEAARLRNDIAELDAAYQAKRLPLARMLRLTEPLEARLAEIDTELAAVEIHPARSAARRLLSTSEINKAWTNLPTAEQREFIGLFWTVALGSPGHGVRRFDPSTVTMTTI